MTLLPHGKPRSTSQVTVVSDRRYDGGVEVSQLSAATSAYIVVSKLRWPCED